MTNDVSVFGGGKVSIADAAAVAKAIGESSNKGARGADGDSLYLNFSGKKGIYTIGPDHRQIGPDEVWLVNIMSFEDGYFCWKGGRPQAVRMAGIYTGVPVQPPAPDELGPFDEASGEGWFAAKGMTIKSADTNEQGLFRINSKSGVSAIADLQRAIGEHMAGNPDERWPIITLTSETFTAQGFKNDKPVFNILGWLSDDAMLKIGEGELTIEEAVNDVLGEAEEEVETKPVTRRRRSARL